MVEINSNAVIEELENVICQKLKDLHLCYKINCLECMSHYGFQVFTTNQKVINENEDEGDLDFTFICPSCMSVNVEDCVDYDFNDYETHYQICKECEFNNRY